MLTIHIPGAELYDEAKEEFITFNAITLELEHSLVSLSKWEAKWEKPFLGSKEKTTEETLSYIEAMTLTPNVPPEVYPRLTNENLEEINEYISAKHSATWFSEKANQSRSREIITSELIYYWMIVANIPLEWENRHLNRLFTLIKVCNQKSNPEKKMSKAELAARNREINAQRKAQLKTKG